MCKIYRHGTDDFLKVIKEEGNGGPVWIADANLSMEIDGNENVVLGVMLGAYDEENDDNITFIIERDENKIADSLKKARLH